MKGRIVNVAVIKNNETHEALKRRLQEFVNTETYTLKSLLLTQELLEINAADYTAWWFRLRCVKKMFETEDDCFKNCTAIEKGNKKRAKEKSTEKKRAVGDCETDDDDEKRARTRTCFDHCFKREIVLETERKRNMKEHVMNEELGRKGNELLEKQMKRLNVEARRLREVKEFFRNERSPFVWYSLETLAKFRSGEMTRRLLLEDDDEEEVERPLTSSAWQTSEIGDFKTLTREKLREYASKIRDIFPRTRYDILDEEYAFAEAMARKKPKNYQVWNHLRQIAMLDDREFTVEKELLDQHSYRRRAFFFQVDAMCDGAVHHYNENFTRASAIRSKYFVEDIILFGDDGAKNIHAWTHYIWIAQNIDCDVWLDIFYATEQCIRKDPRNNSAFSARYNFVEYMLERVFDMNNAAEFNDPGTTAFALTGMLNNTQHLQWNRASLIEIMSNHPDSQNEAKKHVEENSQLAVYNAIDHEVWSSPGPRYGFPLWIFFELIVVMEDILGFSSRLRNKDINSLISKDHNLSKFGFDVDVSAPDSEAALNYVLGVFKLLQRRTERSLDETAKDLRELFWIELEKKIHEVMQVAKDIAEKEQGDMMVDAKDDDDGDGFRQLRDLETYRRLKVCAKLSAARLTEFQDRHARVNYAEMIRFKNATAPIVALEELPERDEDVFRNLSSIMDVLERCIIMDPVRSNFYKQHFLFRTKM